MPVFTVLVSHENPKYYRRFSRLRSRLMARFRRFHSQKSSKNCSRLLFCIHLVKWMVIKVPSMMPTTYSRLVAALNEKLTSNWMQ